MPFNTILTELKYVTQCTLFQPQPGLLQHLAAILANMQRDPSRAEFRQREDAKITYLIVATFYLYASIRRLKDPESV